MLNRRHERNSSLAILLFLLGFALPAFADPVVVVNPQSPVDNITAEEAQNIFLGKNLFLADGTEVKPVDQTAGNPTRDTFYQRITGKNARQLKAYRAKMVFSGRGKPPKEVGDTAAVKRWLENHPDAIGYIDSREVDDRVKVVLIIP